MQAGAAFLAVAGLLVAVHGGAEGRGAWTGSDGAGTEPGGAAKVANAGVGTAPATSAGPTGAPGSEVEVGRTVYLMGTRLEGRAWAGDRSVGLDALEAAFGAVEAEEELLSTWRDDSDLTRLNRADAGTPVEVSARLHGLLGEAGRISRATGGAFDPAVGALVDAWDLRGDGRRPSGRELASARRASGRDCFELGPGRRVTPRCRGAWIDAGAFGKGSGLRRARRALEGTEVRAALLDFGGQLLALGAPPGRGAWPAAVSHPARRDSPLVELRLRDRSAATTSASERFVTIDGRARGHVLDPGTGRPAPAWGSVTVVAEDPLRADALSTALFVMGPEAGWRWARGREDVGVLFLELEDRPDAAREGGDEPGATACWNAAMERWLAQPPVPRWCADGEPRGEPDGETRGERDRESSIESDGEEDRRSKSEF